MTWPEWTKISESFPQASTSLLRTGELTDPAKKASLALECSEENMHLSLYYKGNVAEQKVAMIT